MCIFRQLKDFAITAGHGNKNDLGSFKFQQKPYDLNFDSILVLFVFFQLAQVLTSRLDLERVNEATPCVLAHGHNDLRAAPLVLHPGIGQKDVESGSTESDRTRQVTVERNVPGLKTLSARSRVSDCHILPRLEQPRQTPERAASSHLWSYPLKQLLPPLTPKRWTGHSCGEEGCLAVSAVKKIMQHMFLLFDHTIQFIQSDLLPRLVLACRHFAGGDPATEKVCRCGRGSQTWETRTTKIQIVLGHLRCQRP